MHKMLNAVLVAALVGSAGWTFTVKHETESLRSHLRKVEARVRAEQETIDILKADWSLLTSPERLQKLVDAHKDALALVEPSPAAMVSLSQIPLRLPGPPMAPAAPAGKGGMQVAGAPDRTLTTGGIEPAVED